MANRNTILGFLRGVFAVLIAMSVVVSASAHATTSGDHRIVVTTDSDHGTHLANATGGHEGWTKSTSSPDTKAPGTAKGSRDDGSLCKVLCGFSMIPSVIHNAMASHGRAPWATVRIVAMLPGDAVADIRPPRS